MSFKLTVEPRSAMMDVPVVIRVVGVPPGQTVVLESFLDIEGKRFEAQARFLASEDGTIDTRSSAALPGSSYCGVYQMGLFFAMVAGPNEKTGVRYFKRVVSEPDIVHFRASCAGHVSEASVERVFLHPSVTRIEVAQENGVKGTLFLPPGSTPCAGVLDMFGTAGGLIESRAAMLAAKGFAAFALAYLEHPGCAQRIDDIQFECFEKAIEFMATHPRIDPNRIGIAAICFGALMATLCSIHIPRVRAVVGIGGFHVMPNPSIERLGKRLPSLAAEMAWDCAGRDGSFSLLHMWDNSVNVDLPAVQAASFPIEKGNAALLLISGEADRAWPVPQAHEILMDRLRRAHYSKTFRHLMFPGAGHLLEIPYTPSCLMAYHGTFRTLIDWGGEVHAHQFAREQMWYEMVSFLRRELCDDPDNRAPMSNGATLRISEARPKL
eukprot:TRINITY_DN1719_c0_g1_i4.p2 TRINITY_DN1719_c0_g1~~TRINITY_DN1719_c0_g1_i4.p2  ORF type:complete len:437 (-),score=60.52 TRINITY_DN1719_c0_g1_i4:2011-3321(-)